MLAGDGTDMKGSKSKKLARLDKRWLIISEYRKCRYDLDRVAYRTGVRRRDVEKWVKRFRTTGNINDQPRSGRPRKLTAQQAAALSATVEQEKSVPAAVAQLRKEGVIPKSVSIRTARRAVAKASWFKTPVSRPLLSATAKKKRDKFSRKRYRVGNLVPIDSSIFFLWGYQPRRGIWVRRGTRPTRPKPVKSQKLHVYGGISKHGKTKLVFATGTTGLTKRYRKAGGLELYSGVCAREFQDIMEQHLYPQAKAIMQSAGELEPVFLMDGATPHTAADTITFMRAKGIQFLHGWPPNSPDLNPIENLWAWMKRQVYADHPTTTAAHIAAVEAAWDRVPDDMLKKLMRSFHKRLTKCHQLAGEHTGY
jgi:transposase